MITTELEPLHAGLHSQFARSVARHPERPALWVNGESLSYVRLAERASGLASAVLAAGSSRPLVGVLANRSVTAYAGVLAALAAGRAYLPLNPRFPVDRIAAVLERAEPDAVIVGAEASESLTQLLPLVRSPLTIVLADGEDTNSLEAAHPQHRFVRAPASAPGFRTRSARANDLAYLLFTSGSTGVPKGVPITHGNVQAYVARVLERSGLNSEDRVSQMSDLTFDWSVHDLFPCWAAGACLYVVPERSVFAPAKFIREHELTVWACVPSVVTFLQRMHLLRPGLYPSIRYSAFCGEPLTEEQARGWQTAAPNSIVDNYYGPTEATVAVTAFRVGQDRSDGARNGVVPIGRGWDGVRTRLLDEQGAQVARGESGELCIGGAQVAHGYWRDPDLTAARFADLDDDGTRWYRTGDLAREDATGCLHFVGRIDHQVKVRGYRVELAEIEHVIRQAVVAEHVVVVGWPLGQANAEGLIAFTGGAAESDQEAVLEACRRALPEYMVPRRIHFLDSLPLSANGKVDRKALIHLLAKESV